MSCVTDIDDFTLKGALWVIRARLQRNKAVKYTFFFIFPLRVSFSRNYNCNWRNPSPVLNSVFASIEQDINQLVRVTEMLFLWLESFGFNRKKILAPTFT